MGLARAMGGLLATLAAAAASAQPPPAPPSDPIADLLRQQAPPPPAPPVPTPRPYNPLPSVPTPYTPSPYTPSPSTLPPSTVPPAMPPPRGAEAGPSPVETGRSPGGPPSATDQAYDDRLRASLMAAQGLRGPLDGGWSLIAGAREVFVLELADRRGEVQGAWRDPRRPGVSGFVDAIDRTAEAVVLRFAAVVVTLHGGDGRWSGELREGGRVQPVALRRRGP